MKKYFNLRFVLLFVVLVSPSFSVKAQDGYLQGAVCYSSYDLAFSALVDHSFVQPSATAYFLTFQKISGVWRARQYSLTSSVILSYDQVFPTLVFVDCVPSVAPVFSAVNAAAFWSSALAFVLCCWILAKNAGVIMNAIKRF